MEQSFNQNTGQIIRAVRKYNGFNQVDFARIIGVSQSSLSRLESGEASIELETWGRICSLFAIDYLAYKTGKLELKTKLNNVTDLKMYGGFKIPKRYSYLQGSTVRAALPFINLLPKKGDIQKNYMKSLGFDPDYFSILEAPLNINFLNDIILEIRKRYRLQKLDQSNKKILKAFNDHDIHGHFTQRYYRSKNVHSQFNLFLKNSKFYELDFEWRNLDSEPNSTKFIFKKASHFNEFKLSPELNDFHWNYRKIFVEGLNNLAVDNKGVLTFNDKRESFCEVQISN